MSYAISIDTETLGLSDDAPIIQIGACIFGVRDNPGTIVDEIEFCVSHKVYNNVEPYAAAMNSEILYKIAAWKGYSFSEGVVPGYQAAGTLGFWCDKHMDLFEKGKFVFTGKNFAGFDLPKLKRLPGWDKSFPNYHHHIIDPGNLWWEPATDGAVIPNQTVCKQRAGMEGEVLHTALADARDVAELIQRWWAKQ